MAYQYPLNGGRINASIGGNSTSAGAGYSLISTGNMVLAGGNNITLSQNGQSISIVGGGGGGAALSAGTQSVSTGTVNFVNSNGITFGMSGSNQVTASHNGITSQTNQTIGGYVTGNTTGQSSSSTFDARNMSMSGVGAISLGYSGGMLQMSAPNQSSLSQTGALSISRNGSTISIGVPAVSMGMSNIGNTSGTSGTASNQLIFAGGNNITLSQVTGAGGNTLSIVGGAGGGFSAGMSNVGNTAGTTGLASNQLVFSGGNNITLSQITGAGGNNTLGISAPAVSSLSATGAVSISVNGGTVSIGAPVQSVQTIGFSAIGNTTGSTSATNLDARTINLSGAGNVSVGYSGNSVIISGAGGAGGGVALNDGVNSISSGTARISGSGALTASVNGQTLNLSVPATSSIVGQGAVTIGTAGNTINIGAPTQTNQALGASNGSFTFQTASFGSANGVTFGTSAGSVITASVNTSYAASNHTHGSPTLNLTNLSGTTASASNGLTLSLAAPAMFDAGVSNTIAGGSTYGTMATSLTGGLAFYAGSNIGLSQATAAGGNGSITINAANGGGGGSIGFSAGAASSSLSSVRFADSNGIGFGLNGSVMTASHNGITSQTVQTANLYAGGNSTQLSSTAGVDLRSVSFEGAGIASVGVSQGKVLVSVPAGGGGLTNLVVHAGASTNSVSALSFDDANGVSFGLNGSVITASANAGAAAPVSYNYFNPQDAYVQVTGAHGQGTLHMQPSKVPNVQFDRLVFPIFWSNSTNSTASVTMSLWFGVYTRTNGTFSLASSTSMATNWVAAGNASSASLNGVRLLTMGSTNTILEDQYYFAIISRSTTGGGNGTLQQLVASQQNSSFSGIMGTVSNASVQYTRGLGYYSVSTTGLPNSVAMSELRGNSSMALRQPMFYFLNSTY